MSRFCCVPLIVGLLLGGGVASPSLGQTGQVEGRVLEASSGTALPDVNVQIAETSLGASTTREGRFAIRNVPPGQREVVVSFVGYETVRRTVQVRSNRTTNLQVTLSREAVEAGDITVLARRQYGSKVATSGLKYSASVLDVPQSVQSINGDFLEDQNVERLDELGRNVSGINSFSSYTDFTMRGFRIQEYLVDGTKAQGTFFFANPKMTDVRRVEVVKGPSSVLYGQLEPGGMLNLVTKEPRGTPSRTVSLEGGSYEQFEGAVDLTGPLTDDGTIQYRLLGSFEDGESFRKFQETRHGEVIPKLAWTPGRSTKITVEGRYYSEIRDGQRDRGIVAPPTGNGTFDTDALSIDWTANEPGDEATSSGFAAQGEIRHAFTDAWQVTSTVRYTESTYTNDYHEPRELKRENGEVLVRRNFRDQEWDVDEFAANLNLIGDVTTGPVSHKLLIGGDFDDTEDVLDARFSTSPPDLNVFDPQYGEASPETYDFNFLLDQDEENQSIGLIVQDLVALTPSLKVMGGLRFDSFDQEIQTTGFREEDISSSESDVTLRGGAVYQPRSNVSVYGSYSEGFQPQNVSFQSGEFGGPFDPTESWQVEVGVKGQLFNDRLTASVAGYEIAKTNVLVRDPDNTSQFISIGEVESTGLEVDVIGSITPDWSLTANYSFNDAEVSEDPDESKVGQTQPNAPRHTAALWSRYDLPELGLGFGGGFSFVDDRETFGAVSLPSYTIFDAALYYEWRRYEAQLNVKNLFDERYFQGGYSARTLFPGQPRTFSLEVRVNF